MAGAAMMTGTAAAAPTARGGHKFRTALDRAGGHLLIDLRTLTLGAFDLGPGIENQLLEILVAALALILKNGHWKLLFFHLL
jgi:hypothetical protein